MKTKNKTKRYGFLLSEETDTLIRRMEQETEWTLTLILEKAITMFAEAHDKKNEK